MDTAQDLEVQPNQPAYRIPAGVQPVDLGRQTILTTPQGGQVLVDQVMRQIWQGADGRAGPEILADFERQGLPGPGIRAVLDCLVQAGLLTGPDAVKPADDIRKIIGQGDPLVSVVIVSYNSRAWLPDCLASLANQSYSPLEIIVVDNGSNDGSPDWLAEHHPEVSLVRLRDGGSLAGAINRGIEVGRGEYILLLNPDVVLDADTVSRLVEIAQSDERCAAVAAKLRLLWAPAFLNGLGNLVGALSWGTDAALGHLDLGQFDHWTELPSACFAATLLPVRAVQEIGPLDEGFPMYYEDSEWCYRARLFGYTVRLAPKAAVYHAFSGRTPGGSAGAPASALGAVKLQRVVYGRLRFITRLLGPGYWLRFFAGYLLEDLLNGLLYLVRGRFGHVGAFPRAWRDYFAALPELRRQRRMIQQRRKLADRKLFRLQRQAPVPLIRGGRPLLTWDIICHEYLPRLQATQAAKPRMGLKRALAIWRVEGFSAMAHRIGRIMVWRLMQP
jgi:GT2 family glycosyltransferase